ncbi:MAG: 30S ribosome-binding factor RbfA [Gammaproteobacteria bacterium]|nr:30S ribosome-binding factor RbfA [Gammaproteobacteria bacterium]
MASQIQRELARLIQSGLKDPRLAAPSILEVQVSKDLAYAKVFFSVLSAEDADGCLEALNRASGFLQREIGKQLKSRVTPKLSFIYDDTDIRGRQLSDLIDSAVASDKNKASQ